MRLLVSYVTVPSHVTAFAAVPRVPLFDQVVTVHPLVLQFLLPSALTQNVIPVTHPGAYVRVLATTALLAFAELLPVLESPGLEIFTVKVTFVPPAAGSGITGIRNVSDASGSMAVVLVQVTVVHTCAPQNQPLSLKELTGPEILVGRVSTAV